MKKTFFIAVLMLLAALAMGVSAVNVCNGTALSCSTWGGNSSVCGTQRGCSYNTTESFLVISPVSNGTYNAFTGYPSAIVPHWTNIDEYPIADDLDGVFSSAINANDTYILSNVTIPSGAVINNVTVFVRAKQVNTGGNQFQIIVKSGGTSSWNVSPIITTNLSFELYNYTLPTNFSGGAWAGSNINGLEVGESIDGGVSPGVNVSQVYVVVDYTPNVCSDAPFHALCNTTNYPDQTSCEGNFSCAWYPSTDYISAIQYLPVNLFSTANTTIAFLVGCNASGVIDSLAIYSNLTGVWNQSYLNSSYVNGSVWTQTVLGLTPSQYLWAVYCNDSTSNSSWSANRTFYIVNASAPSPVNNGLCGACNSGVLVDNFVCTISCLSLSFLLIIFVLAFMVLYLSLMRGNNLNE